jgi:hypothetical protein
MDYIQGKPRSQLVLIESFLEERIEQNNPVRIIDVFVDSCKLDEFGFTHARPSREGRPRLLSRHYPPKPLILPLTLNNSFTIRKQIPTSAPGEIFFTRTAVGITKKMNTE